MLINLTDNKFEFLVGNRKYYIEFVDTKGVYMYIRDDMQWVQIMNAEETKSLIDKRKKLID